MPQPWRPVALQVGRTIKKLRKERGLTQEQLVDLLADKDIENFRRIEQGRRNVTLSTLQRIAEALNVPVARLFEGDEP